MPIIFTPDHVKMILDGKKTMTRRVHRYRLKEGNIYKVKKNWYIYYIPGLSIKVTHSIKQRLGDITPEDAMKEGGYTVEEFKEIWTKINGSWTPDLIVNVYEFEVVKKL